MLLTRSMPSCWLATCYWTLLFFTFPTCPARRHYPTHRPLNDNETFQYITRPDIRAPRWHVTKLDESRISPGYWFVAPYEHLSRRQDDSGHGAVGAHIYDNDGELIWSGVPTFRERNILDFKLSTVEGQEMLTLIHQEDGNGVVLDNHYKIRKVVDLGEPGVSSNPHEFLFIQNGTRALITTQRLESTPRVMAQMIDRKQCNALWQGFEEIDVATWQPVFRWESLAQVGLDESTFVQNMDDCDDDQGGWDYLHLDSVDKIPGGDYLLSARHTDTIYRVSAQNGSVIWRLGGTLSDFAVAKGDRFVRQHDVRFRGQNETHMLISFLDNARGDDTKKPSRWGSRAVLMALDTANMEAKIEQEVAHPDGPGRWAWRRGNYQKLVNGNAFICWSEQAQQSEYAPDGEMVLEAKLLSKRLGTYRAYKFPFVGEPTTLPDVHSAAFAGLNGSTMTLVHVSWNGATEVDAWNLYKTTESNDTMLPIASRRREGFETALAYEGFAAYIIIEAIDKDGSVLASSAVTKTELPQVLNAAVAKEVLWLQKEQDGIATPAKAKSTPRRSLVPLVLGFLCSSVTMSLALLVPRGIGSGYTSLQDGSGDEAGGSSDRDEAKKGSRFLRQNQELAL